MGFKTYIRKMLDILVKQFGYEIIQSHVLYEWQKTNFIKREYTELKLPEGADEYLRADNNKLVELKKKYSECNKEVTDHVLWQDENLSSLDLKHFRGDHSDRSYLYQIKGINMGILNYIISMYYIKTIDSLDLLELLTEDDYFGIFNFSIDNKAISRDLIDSIVEIYFLEKYLNISKMRDVRILDIGAGYGRLAHRMVSALSNISQYICTDAVPISTFISEYYLKFRNLEHLTKVVPLHTIEKELGMVDVEIAVNIHSFSECKFSAINWWVSLLKRNRVKYLMIAPNALDNGGKFLLSHDGIDFSDLINDYGYKLIAKEPKYRDLSIQEYGINPTYYYLFELN